MLEAASMQACGWPARRTRTLAVAGCGRTGTALRSISAQAERHQEPGDHATRPIRSASRLSADSPQLLHAQTHRAPSRPVRSPVHNAASRIHGRAHDPPRSPAVRADDAQTRRRDGAARHVAHRGGTTNVALPSISPGVPPGDCADSIFCQPRPRPGALQRPSASARAGCSTES